MKANEVKSSSASALGRLLVISALTGCTQQLPGAYLLQQQTQAFTAANLQINTKIDMLWVVDNSSSMDPDQQKLRTAFSAFATKYMQPTWDIRVAAITTDTYLANSIFSHYLGKTISGSGDAADPYIKPLVQNASYVLPTDSPNWNVSEASVVQLTGVNAGNYNSSGVLINDLVPAWGPNYAKLLPGLHDGPIAGLCSSFMPYFLRGENQCSIRDSRAQTGIASCLNPSAGQSSVSQCVNTVQNDTIHTGLPVISTLPPQGVAGDVNWVTNLVNNFIINLTTGTTGMGSERGLGSVLQLLSDNEAAGSTTQFFRPGSLRVIVFISDEDDQTLSYSAADQANLNFSPWTHYQCDQAGLNSLNMTSGRLPGNYCCSGGSCSFGADATSCPSKTILNNDGSNYTYTISTCPNPSLLLPVSSMKTQLDTFFAGLDGGGTASPNYFVVTITGLTGDSIRTLQAIHDVDDANAGAPVQVTADRADRYISLGNLVGNGSMAMDITSADYTPILNAIGTQIIQKKGTFTLGYPATGQQQMTVTIQHADGTATIVQNSQYTVSGTTLTITDVNLILTLKTTDQIGVNYQPSTSYNPV